MRAIILRVAQQWHLKVLTTSAQVNCCIYLNLKTLGVKISESMSNNSGRFVVTGSHSNG